MFRGLKNTFFFVGLLGVMLLGTGTSVPADEGEKKTTAASDVNLVEEGAELTAEDVSYDPSVEVACEEFATLTCFDITNKLSDFVPDANRCAPRSVTWQVGFGFAGPDTGGQTIDIQFFWNWPDITPTWKTNVGATWNGSRYVATANFTYPTNEVLCTYVLRARLRFDGSHCTNADGNITEGVVVWDDLSNANLGNHDISHDNTSAGVEVGETVEVCLTDTSPVRLVDNSTFNCQAPIEPTPTNENRRQRWVQWVYGTAGTTVTDDVIVDAVTYTSAQWPIYGTPTLQPFPPDVLGPNAITDDIQMPATASVGEIFEVTIRSWNVCNPYANDGSLVPDGGGPFLINNPPGTLQTPLPDTHADDTPITRTFDIVIAPQPVDPVAVQKDVCNGNGLPNFQVTAAGNVAVEWFEDNAGAPGPGITNSLGGNSLQLPTTDFEPGGAINNNNSGVYLVWARYSSNTGSQNCWSNPVQTSLDIREDLTQPTMVAPPTQTCDGVSGIPFSLTDPEGSEPIGGNWSYQWQVTGGGGVTIDDTDPQNVLVDVNVTGVFVTTTRTIRVRKRYDAATTNGTPGNCESPWEDQLLTIYGQTNQGVLTGGANICEDDESSLSISWTGIHTLIGWEVDAGGGFFGYGAGGTDNPMTPPTSTLAPGTYQFRAVIDNGPCTAVRSPDITVTVNPVPPKPTISEVGDGLMICQDGSSTILQSSDVGGIADEYHWFKAPDFVTPVQAGNSNQLTLTAPAESGTYHVQTIGINPTDCPSVLSDGVVVTISPLPTATVSGGGSSCLGTPAPDITWTFTGSQPYNFTITLTPGAPIIVAGHNSNTYTIVGPNPGVDTDYEMTALTDGNTCVGVSLGGIVTVQDILTPPPVVESFIATAAVCDDGAGTNPPDAILDLTPNSVQNYDFTYEVNGNVHVEANVASDINGRITISPPYSDWGSVPGTYVVTVTALKNTVTQCAGAVPFDSDPLIINARPNAPANPVNNIACSDGGGTMLSVDVPAGATEVVRWFLADGTTPVADPADGTLSGSKDSEFTPAVSTTATFFTRVEETSTTCLSAASVQLDLTEDTDPPDASIITADFNTCNTSEDIQATAVVGGFGEWVFSSGLVWREAFDDLSDGQNLDNEATAWSLDLVDVDAGRVNNPFEVAPDAIMGRRFMVNNPGSNGVRWFSEPINTAAVTGNVTFSVDVAHQGIGGNDWIEGYYNLDGSGTFPIGAPNWFGRDTGPGVIQPSYSLTIPAGAQLQLMIRIRNGGPAEFIYIDNVEVREDLGAAIPTITETVADPRPDRYNENVTVSGLLETELIPGTNEFTWNAYSNLGVCRPAPATLTITRWTLPDAIDTTPDICEDTYNSDQATIPDLTVYNDGVTGIAGSTDRTITYYSDAGRTMPVVTTTVTVALPKVYTTVTRTDVLPNCPQNGELTFNILTLPEGVDQNAGNNALADLCEESVGSGDKDNIDLTAFNNAVINSQASRTVVWYLDPGGPVTDPSDLVAPVPTPGDVDNVVDGTNFYALITETASGSLCENFAQVQFTIKPKPFDNPIQAPDLSTPLSITLCKSTANQLFQVDDLLNAGSTYAWTVPTGPGQFDVIGPTNLQFVVIQAPDAIPGGLPITLVETLPNGCVGNVNTITVIVEDAPPAPVIVGPANVCDGQNGVTYNILAPIVGNTYAWNINGLGTIVLGQGTDEITVNIASTSDVITVVENSPAGCSSPPAAPYNVTVNPLPNMTSSNAEAICSNAAVNSVLTFTDDIGGGGSYDWEVVAKSGSVGGTSVGTTGTGDITTTLTNISGSSGDVTYEVKPTSAAPASCTGPTQIVTITVYSEAVGQNTLEPICSDVANNYDIQVANIDFLGNNVPSNFTYTVSSSDEANVPSLGLDRGVPSNAAITDTYTNLTGVPVDMTYSIVPIESVSGNNCTGASFDVVFRISSEPVGIASLEANVCSDVAFSFDPQDNVNAVGGNSMASTFAWTANYGVLSGVGSGTGNVAETISNTTGGSVNVIYTVTPTAAGCLGDPFTITVPIDSEPLAISTTETTVCSDQNFTFDPQDNVDAVGGNSTPSTFTWTAVYNGMTGGAGVGVNTISETLNNVTGATANAVYTIIPTSIAGTCLGDPFTITVPVFSDPLGINSTEAIVCSDQVFTFDPQDNVDALGGNLVPSTFSWTANYSGMTGGAGSGTGVINEGLNNVSGGTLSAIYTITPTSILGTCVGNTFTITVPVYSDPLGINSTEAAVCSQDTFTFDPQDNVDAVGGNSVTSTFSWVANYGVLTGGAGTGVGAISETLVNTSGATVSAVYTITPTSTLGGCTGNMFTISVPVDSEPVGIDTTEPTVCSDTNFNLNPQDNINAVGGNSLASTFSWTANYSTLTGGAGSGTGLISETLNNVSGGVVNAVYTITPTSVVGVCVGSTFTITVPIYSDPLGVSSTETVVCSDQPFAFNPQSNVNAAGGNSVTSTFSWTAAYGATTGGAGAGTGIISETLNNISGGIVNVVYTVTPTSVVGTCLGDPFTITVPVYSDPLGINSTETVVCSDQPFSFDPQDNIDAVGGNLVTSNFSWTAAYGALTGGAGSGTGIISETLNNVSGGTLNAVYTITPTSSLGACIGDPFTITVPVYSDPLGINSTEANVCSDIAFSFDPQDNVDAVGGNNVPSTFSWTANYGLLTGGAGAGAGIINETLNNVTAATINAVYTVTPTSVTGTCQGSTFTITVPIDPEPLGANSTETAVCSDVAFSFDPQDNISNLPPGSTFAWTAVYGGTISGGAGSGTGLISETLNNVSGGQLNAVYTVIPTSSGSLCIGNSFTITVPINSEPLGSNTTEAAVCSDVSFNFDPQANISNGQISSFAWTAAYGGGLTGGSGSGTGNISETLTNTSIGQLNAVYTVTPTAGGCVGNTYTITVPIDPEPLGGNSTEAAVCSDIPFSFDPQTNIVNLPPGSTFAWTASYGAGLSGGAGVGAGLVAETLNNVTGGQLNAVYTITPTSSGSLCVGNTFTITVPVDPEPLGANSTETAVCSDIAFSFDPQNNISNLPPGSTFAWTAVYGGTISGGAGSGTGLIAETLNNVSGGQLNAVYTVIPTSVGSLCAGNSFTITVPINSEPLGANTVEAAVCSDVSFNFDPQGNISNGQVSSFAWTAAYGGSLSGGAGSGTGNISETLTNTSAGQLNAVYTVTPTAGGCLGDTYTITVPIDPEPLGGNSTEIAVCSDIPFSFDPQNNITNLPPGSTFAWTATYGAGLSGGTGVGTGLVAETLNNVTGGQLNAVYTITPTSSGSLCVGNTFTITVPVDPEPLGANSTETAVCSDVPFSFDPQNNISNLPPGSTFAWTAVYGGTISGGAGSGTGLIAETLNNVSGGQLNAVYTVIPTSAGSLCAGNSYTITVPISSEPLGSNTVEAAVCSDVSFNFDPQSNITNGQFSSFAWTATYAGTLSGGLGVGVGNINETLNNISAATLDAVYTITPTSGGCVGNTFTITVPIDPEPLGSNSTESAVCSDVAFSFDPQANISNLPPGSTFAWSAVYAGTLSGGAGTGIGLVAETLTNTSNGQLDAVYTITPTSAGSLCAGNTFTITVPIDPEPFGTSSTETAVCSDVPFSFNPQNNISNLPPGSTFAWTATYGGTLAGGAGSGTGLISETLTNISGGQLNAVYTVIPTSVGTLCIGDAFTITVPINSEPLGTNTVEAAICSDVAFNFDPQANITNGQISTFAWTAAYGGGLLGGAGSGTGTISESLNNVTAGQLNAVYTITPTSGGCVGNTYTITVPIDPEPLGANTTAAAVCSDVPFVVDPQGNISNLPPGSTFAWTAVYNGTLSGGAGAGTGLISETITNTSAGQLDAVYTIIPTSLGSLCIGNSFTITVPIDPEPAGTNSTEIAVCSDTPFSFDPQANITNLPPGNTFAWTAVYGGTITGGAGSGTGIINETLTNTSGGLLNAVYTVIPTAPATLCIGDAFTITVPINSEPAGFDDLGNAANELCSQDFINYNIQTLNIDDIGNGGNALPSNFTYTVSSSDEANVPSAGLDRVAPSTSPITDSFYNNTAADVTITYSIIPFGFVSGCEGDPFDVEFVIYPQPRGFNDALTQCSDDLINYDINVLNINMGAGNSIPSDFTYTVSSNNALVNPEPNRTTKSDLPISYTYTNTSALDADITYTITPISKANNCVGDQFTVVFTIQVEPAGANYSETQCGGSTLNHDLNTDIVNGIDSKFYYTVASNNGGVPAGPDRPFASASDAPITDSYNNTTAVNAVITYTVTPIDKLTNCEGNAFLAVFTIEPGPEGVPDAEEECSGIALNYDIQADNINNGGNNVPGKFTYTVSSSNQPMVPAELPRVTASTLPITHTYVNQTTNDVDITYTITPEGFGAGCVGAPFDVVFTINPEPVIIANSATICSRDAIPISMTMSNFAVGDVDWTYVVTNISGVVTGVNVSDNGITNTLPQIITNVTSGDAIITYRFTATSISKGCISASEDVLVTVQPEPLMSNSLSNTTCSGENSAIELATNGTSAPAANFRMITSVADVGLTADVSNAVDGSLGDKNLIINDNFVNTTNGPLDVTYTVEAISANNCTGSPAVVFTLTVNPEPVLSTTLDPTPVCSDVASGVMLGVELPGSVAADRYHIVGITFDPGLIPGGTNAAIANDQPANVLAADTYTNTTNGVLFATYQIIPVSAAPANCEGEVAQVRFTVNPAPRLSPALDEIACSDEASGIMLDDDGVSIAATNFDIISIIPDVGLAADPGNASGGITADPNVLAGDRFINSTNGTLNVIYEVVPISAASCRGPSGFITLVVEPTLTATANNTNPNICSGEKTFIELNSASVPSAGAMSFNITAAANGNVTGFIASLNNLPVGYKIEDFLTNNENVMRTVTYTVTPRAEGGSGGSGCSGAPILVTVDVDPAPDVIPTNNAAVICSGEDTNIDLASSVAGSTFTWTAVSSDGTLTGEGPGSGTNIAQTLVNSGSSLQFVTYTITPVGPAALNCVGNTFDVQVQVNPLPVAAISGATSICAGSFATLQIDMQGQLPFTVVYSDGTTNETIANVGNTHFLNVSPTTTTTYTLVSVADGNGCQQPSLGGAVTVSVEDAVADFTVESVDEGCSPLLVSFRNNMVETGVTYEWTWGDGSSSTFTSDEVVEHEFTNNSTSTTLSYNVTLIATNDALGCMDLTTETVQVYPSIFMSIIPSTDKGCGPVTVSFTNNSLGIVDHKWFYRVQGTTEEIDTQTTPFATYELPNKTATPITYEVVYTGSNGNCQEEVVSEVLVLPELEPSFTVGDNPVEVTTTPHVTVTNTTPNKDAWTYVWEWGDGTTTSAVDPGSHTYVNEQGEPTYGNFEIVQRVTYEDVSGKCEAVTSIIFNVEPVFPEVDFEADVLEGCRPVVVNFTNLSVAVDPETVFWEFVAPTGAVEATSSEYNPTFTFYNAGRYTIRLTAGNAIGVTETETKEFYINVNELPISSFTVRPDKVFLPDGIVYTQNLSGNGADTYFWIFNVADYLDPTSDGILDESDLVSTLYEPEVTYQRRGWKDIMLISTISETGCSDTLYVEQAVFVDEGGNARVPNAFTPSKNGPGAGGSGGSGGSSGSGGFNEVFLPVVQGLSGEPGSFHMLVYDRWGNLIFESWDREIGWDGYDENGKLLPLGVYVYKLDLRFNDGTTGVRIGDVTLIR